ncbi:MAG: HlyC/CorC family transporter, partial [Firmicutes bacterium]|nr:HlyC/CorC family transporter [Bacillota bacterium]
MSSDAGPIWVYIVILIAIILLHGYISAARAAMESLNRNNIRNLAQEGNAKAKAMLDTVEEPFRYLFATEVTLTFMGFFLSAFGAVYLTDRLLYEVEKSGIPYFRGITLIICTIVLSYIILVFGIMLPKRVGLLHADKIALSTYGKARIICMVMKPLAILVNGLVILILKIFRQRTDVTEAIYSEDEVVSMLESGQESGELKKEGMKMITSIFAFDDMLAYEVMTPRTDVFSIDINEPSEEYIDELMELRYSRIPVYEDDSDNIIGILYIKDYLIKAREDGFDNVDIRAILRKPYLVPETKKIDTLFVELQQTKQHIAILIDEYGG